MQIFRNKHHPADVVGPENWFAKSGFYRKSWFWPDSKARQKQRNESARAAERPKIISVMWWFIVDLSLECGGDLTPSLRWEHIKFHSNGRWSNSGVKKKKNILDALKVKSDTVSVSYSLWWTFGWLFLECSSDEGGQLIVQGPRNTLLWLVEVNRQGVWADGRRAGEPLCQSFKGHIFFSKANFLI